MGRGWDSPQVLTSLPAKPIFIGGTGSHAGKSWVATAVCRHLHRLGHRVAPFKAQNMSNNSMVCAGGGEIGRAQAAQAEACGLAPHPDMNPILLKPTGTLGSQVVLNGLPWRNISAAGYYTHYDALLRIVLDSYDRLAADFDYVVIEGAGSISELNLKRWDLVNLGLAVRLKAPVILVADIERGGVFASIVGTFHLLAPEESALVRTFMVNRFRGDMELFRDGVTILEERTGRRCLGVFPYANGIDLDPEDSVSLDDRTELHPSAASETTKRIAIIRLPHISNFTDFRLMPEASYVSQPVKEQFDVIFIPGTKNTIDDMLWLRSSGLEEWLTRQYRAGATIVGLCGGYQMLGDEILDPDGVESSITGVRGLALVPGTTRLMAQKITLSRTARTTSGIPFCAYEIHMGATTLNKSLPPFALLEDGSPEGVRLPRLIGTYLHGAFENKLVLEEVLRQRLDKDVSVSKDTQYDRLAHWFTSHVDHELFKKEYL